MLEGYGEILINSATDIPEIRIDRIHHAFHAGRASFRTSRPWSKRLIRALAKADEADEGRHRASRATPSSPRWRPSRSARRPTRSSPSCSGTTCARISRPRWRSPRPAWPERGTFFHIPSCAERRRADRQFLRPARRWLGREIKRFRGSADRLRTVASYVPIEEDPSHVDRCVAGRHLQVQGERRSRP